MNNIKSADERRAQLEEGVRGRIDYLIYRAVSSGSSCTRVPDDIREDRRWNSIKAEVERKGYQVQESGVVFRKTRICV